MNKKVSLQKGFTMVELLVVMSIVAILTSLSVLGLKSIMGDTGLTGAGNQMSQFFTFARQEAISKNTLVAVVVLTTPNVGSAQYRTFSAWELALPANGTAPTSSNWVQASKWVTLPAGIVVDVSTAIDPNLATTASSFALSATPVTSPAALPSMNYLGQNVNPATDCAAQVFTPSGRLNSSSPNLCMLTLVERNPNPASLPANYVTYIFNPATGETKVVRP